MRTDFIEQHNVATEHPDIVKQMLDQAEQCRVDLGDTALNRKGSGVRESGGVR